MALLSILVPDIRAEIPEVPSFVAQRQILRAMREFCEETRTWRHNTTLSTVVSQATYTLSLPTNTELVDVISIKNSGGYDPLVPRTYAWLDENTSDWRSESDENATRYVIHQNNAIRLVPIPASTTTNKYYVRVAVKPTLSATTFDDIVANKYDQLLIHGALANLYRIPRKTWSDPNLSEYHRQLFMAGWPKARTEAADEFQTGVPRKVKYGGL